VADPIDALESMICDTLQAAQADGIVSEVRAKIQAWRVKFGGDEVYIARRAHLARQEKIAELSSKGLSTEEISQRLGASMRQVQRVKQQRTSSYL
jgi:DNA-binding NarL/FixJ family response regulator